MLSAPAVAAAPEPAPEVLVADDEGLSRGLVVRALEMAGFRCRQCADGTAALAEAERDTPALLLLDFDMPGLDGTEVCRRVRAHADPTVASLPIIMMTGLTGEEQEVRCLESGADDFVSKPVNLAVLRARINTHLRLRALRRQLETQNAELARWRAELERDLESARLTQQAIIPSRLPALTGWELATYYQPKIQVGGDIYDWLPLPDGRWLFWIADATGHGTAAALLTTLTKLLFRHAAAQSSSPAEILRLVNNDLRQIFRGRPLMTAMAAALDPLTGELSFAGAGHPPLFLIRGEEGRSSSVAVVEERFSQVPPLGLRIAADPVEEETELALGDVLLLFTDGFYGLPPAGGDADDPDGRRLELDALRRFAGEAAVEAPDAEGLMAGLLDRVRTYAGRKEFPDDLAAVVVRRRPREPGTVGNN